MCINIGGWRIKEERKKNAQISITIAYSCTHTRKNYAILKTTNPYIGNGVEYWAVQISLFELMSRSMLI